jgi:O-antigen ligase
VAAAPLLLVLPLLALWPVVMLSGWADSMTPVLLPAGLAAAAAAAFLTYHAIRRERWALLLLMTSVVALSINFRVREYGATGLDWQNGFKLATWLLLALVCALNWRRVVGLWQDPVLGLLAAFTAIACLSASYSVVPAYSAACALSLAVYLAFGCLLATTFSEQQLVRWMIGCLTAYLLLNWVFTALAPTAGILDTPYDGLRLQGLSGHPNSLARQADVYLCLVIGGYFRGHLRRPWFFALLALGAVTVIATGSRTALLAVVGAAALVGLRHRRLLLPGLAAMLMLGLLLFAVVPISDFSRSGDSSEILTLTGRTQLWSFVLDKIMQHPILGHGLNSFEAAVVDDWFGNPDAGVATHNNFLEVLFSCGVVGFLPFMSALGVLVWRWLKHPNVLRDVFVLDLLISSLTEVDIALAIVPTFVLFLLLAINAEPRGKTAAAAQVRYA